MDSVRGRNQHSFKAYKSTSPSSRNLDNTSSNHGIFRPRIQRPMLKWRKDYYHKGNYRSRLPYRKSDISNKKSNKTAEDKEEEERKKKLTDTAKNLLNKLKTWNAEKSYSEDDLSQNCNISKADKESSSKCIEEKISSEDKPKRIAHSKKARLIKSRTKKNFCQLAKTKTRYDVNKETVRDFQNRIQHKLIEEIMQMPKENLQNVLNDPKINPIMELKMSRLVRENKPLIAQKLRALAESKMKSLDYSTNSQLLDDIDKFIDPVIETDLSVLPYELIKQMENIFQVQFDYSQNSSDSQVKNTVCESAMDNVTVVGNFAMEINNPKQIKIESNEDLSLYECSTDEDEEISASKSVDSNQEQHAFLLDESLTQGARESNEKAEKNEKRTLIQCSEPVRGNNVETHSSPLKVSKEEKSFKDHENVTLTANCPSSKNLTSGHCISEEQIWNSSKSLGESATISCQTNYNYEDASTQTQTTFEVLETLYGVPIPKETTDENPSSLLNEVNSIQVLVNKLNERRLMIFLQLAKTNPSGNFINDDITKTNFLESVSNGDLYLVESLNQFFSVYQKGNYKHLKNKPKKSGRKSSDCWKKKNRLRNKEEKDSQN